MDSENESMLRAAISTAAQDRTLVVVAHRLSTIIDSDVIFVLRDGRIEDRGTHRQLLDSNETYYRFAQQQSLVSAGPVDGSPMLGGDI
jgi:ATP-binding cassette subfamily B protein